MLAPVRLLMIYHIDRGAWPARATFCAAFPGYT